MLERAKKRRRVEVTSTTSTTITSSTSAVETQATWKGEYVAIDLQDQATPVLPGEMWDLINRRLPDFDKSQFAMTCKGAYALGTTYDKNNSNHFYNSFIYKKKLLVRELLSYIVKGDEDSAYILIRSHPHLLLEKGMIKDHLNRPIKGTAFQIALQFQDIDMCKMIEPFFEKLAEGKTAKRNQFQESFPQGIVKQKHYDVKFLVEAIREASNEDIIKALLNLENDSHLCHALKIFRNEFEMISKNEMYFNPNHLLQAFMLYDEKFGRMDALQRNLFFRQVMGYMQCFVPACYMQAFCQGIYFLTVQKEELQRDFICRLGGNVNIPFPLNQEAPIGLGSIFALGGRILTEALQPGSSGARDLNHLIKQKEDYLTYLEADCRPEAPSISCSY